MINLLIFTQFWIRSARFSFKLEQIKPKGSTLKNTSPLYRLTTPIPLFLVGSKLLFLVGNTDKTVSVLVIGE